MRKDNRIVIDLNKVQWAKFYYQNQYGDRRSTKPTVPTNRDVAFDSNAICFGDVLTMYQYAKKHNLLDVWIPHVVFKLTASETLVYSGDKANSLYGEYCSRIFKRTNNKRRKKQ